MPSQPHCSCGELNPLNFYKTNKARCKKCCIIKATARRAAKGRKPRVKTKLPVNQKINGMVHSCHYRAKQKGLPCTISKHDIQALLLKQNGRCAYSNLEFIENSHKYGMSVDRVDSSKGYTIDNIQLVCITVNLMKNDLSEKQFLDVIKAIYENKY